MSDARIAELRGRLKEAREAYYNLSPAMSDQEYDALKDELAALSPDDAEVTAVGADPIKVSVWEKVEHEIPMGSLSKVNEEEEFRQWATGTGAGSFLITHKIDGSSLEVIYEGGRLLRCVTRGNGKVGEDVTRNASQIPTIPGTIPITHERVVVRGEVMMMKQVFQDHYADQYANPRNTAAGKIRELKGGGADCRNLSFLAFTLMSPSAPGKEHVRFAALKKMGFETPWWELANGTAEVVRAHTVVDEGREAIPYEIDGTVVRVDDMTLQAELGDLNMRPRGQMAWKFDPAMGVTKVLDVKWQVGPTGRVTPVAVLEPVEVGGVTIVNVSLHNLSMFKDLGLWAGCEVLISRRNDVIPYVERNLSREKDQDSDSAA